MTYTISLAYNDAHVLDAALESYYRTTRRMGTHLILDQHWPIEHEKVKQVLEKWYLREKIILLDAGRNIGLHKGFNFCLDHIKDLVTEDELIIGYDLDCNPITKDWDKAMVEILLADKSVGWMSLWHQHCQRELFEEKRLCGEYEIAGHKIVETGAPCLNSVCGFRYGWLKKVGGLKEPREWYGGLECCMWQSLKDNKMKWVFLKDYLEVPFENVEVNPLYREYKWEYAHKGSTDEEFGEWLKKR